MPMIFCGLGSGIVRALLENVQIGFINEEAANQFRVIIWRTTPKNPSITQKAVLEYFRSYPKGTRAEAANVILELSEDGVKYIIGRLQQLGFLKRKGGRKDGYWVVIGV